MPPTAKQPPTVVTRYFAWEGDACRLHQQTNGDLTADIYRAGKGLLPISAADLLFGAVEIGHSRYRDLVEEEDSLRLVKRA